MRTFSIVAVCVTNLLIGLRYVWLIRRDKISPALAMWVFFTIAVIGSLVTYLSEGDYGLMDNVLNSADLVLCGGVALAIAVWGNRHSRFNRFDVGCLWGVILILVMWAITRQHVVAHLAIQLILVLAYFPVIRRLWRSDHNTESFTMWIGLTLAPMFSLLSSQGGLATIYAIRAMISTSLLLALMIRVEIRSKKRMPIQ
ncbi:hypothetical protein KKG90_03380 [Candidatus Bipolaricaulota bacterium]|nr:hypothetical protein [Candidatus Bipolaricaulota bacterium]